MQTYQTLIPKTLPDGTTTDNYSQTWQRYCEALHLSKQSLSERRNFLHKIQNQEKRVTDLQYWLQQIWKEKNGR